MVTFTKEQLERIKEMIPIQITGSGFDRQEGWNEAIQEVHERLKKLEQENEIDKKLIKALIALPLKYRRPVQALINSFLEVQKDE